MVTSPITTTVILVVYNQLGLTRACLESLLPAVRPFELCVVDLFGQTTLEKAPVGNAGKRIGEAIELETLMIDRVVDAQCRHGRQVLEQIRRYTGHEMLRIAAALIETAYQFATANKRRDRHRPRGTGIV